MSTHNSITFHPITGEESRSNTYEKYGRPNVEVALLDSYKQQSITAFELVGHIFSRWFDIYRYDQIKYRPPIFILTGSTQDWLRGCTTLVEFYTCVWFLNKHPYIRHQITYYTKPNLPDGEVDEIDIIFPNSDITYWELSDYVDDEYDDLVDFVKTHLSNSYISP